MARPFLDDAGRPLSIAEPPRRIVSLVPSLTEVVCALGAAPRLVGVTRYCTDPADVVARLPRVGGTKNPALDRIAALDPDLVLVNSEENREEDFDRLRADGMAAFVSFPRTVSEAADSIERIGLVLGCVPEASALAAEIRAAIRTPPRAQRRVFCPIWRNPWMSFNRDTYAHDLLRCAGGANVCAEADERYPVVHLAEAVGAAPDIVLLPDEPYRFDEAHRREIDDAFAPRRLTVHLVDGKALSWYGPRTAAAVRYFREMIETSEQGRGLRSED